MIEHICVFCGSSNGTEETYLKVAEATGRMIAANGYGLVFGGVEKGLMRKVADAALDQGGKVIGVVPRAFLEIRHRGVSDIRITEDLLDRKATMIKLANGFIGLPGGVGTYEEIFEVITLKKLGFLDKPIGLINVGEYFSQFQSLIKHGIEAGLIPSDVQGSYFISDSPDRVFQVLNTYKPA